MKMMASYSQLDYNEKINLDGTNEEKARNGAK